MTQHVSSTLVGDIVNGSSSGNDLKRSEWAVGNRFMLEENSGSLSFSEIEDKDVAPTNEIRKPLPESLVV